ncbi:MAG: AAA family ATPase [Nanoarchaeota archaeon]|nr:AAA family ATPase [Nanoarchaeota archaeon]MBU4452061.1 AAA family ATPase [Nanoarchaeota archaeon]MCG2724442.1 AAA family ATPase [archaeon]
MLSKASLWFSEHNWTKNPFTLDISHSLFVGRTDQLNTVENSIEEGQKYIIITGPTGAGKTTLMKYLANKYDCLYIPKPPVKKEELVCILKSNILYPSIFHRLFDNKSIDAFNISEHLNNKLKGKRTVILIDEAHETDIEMLAWLRSIIEQVNGVTLILAALPKLKEEHLKTLETFSQRVTADIELRAFSKDESVELVKKRIVSVGGRTLEPFTLDALNEIYVLSGGSPREILKVCNNIVHKAIEKGASIIDRSYLSDFTKPEITDSGSAMIDSADGIADALNMLTDKQIRIIELVGQNGHMTPSDIVKKTSDIEGSAYQSDAHALRAVNNILRRLERDRIIIRERKGRTYRYFISPKYKSRFVKA